MIHLPNLARLHRFASRLARATAEDTTSINIEGPPAGTYTAYRMTPEARRSVLAEARRRPGVSSRRAPARNRTRVRKPRTPEPFIFKDRP